MKQPKIQPVFQTDTCELVEDFALVLLAILIRVPKGFIFDGASIPRAAWSVLGYTPFHPQVILAALVHDWLYLNHQCSRAEADLIFKILLLKNGVDPHAAEQMYLAVRSAGWLFWRHSENDLEKLKFLRAECDPEWIGYYFPVQNISDQIL